MRITAGIYGGRIIQAMPSKTTRPTTSRVKEAWASSVGSFMPKGSIEGARVLDAFAGSGSLGLELLSRGAESCLFIERDRRAAKILKENIKSLGLTARQAKVSVSDSLSHKILEGARGTGPFDIVVLDPPYSTELKQVTELLSTLAAAQLLAEPCLISYEHAAEATDELPSTLESLNNEKQWTLQLVRRKKYGTICIDYYKAN